MARGHNKIFRPQLFWDPGDKVYLLKVPQDEAFINDLRTFVCDTPPTYNGKGFWQIDEADVEDVKIAISGHFPEATYGKLDFIEKPDPTARRERGNGAEPNAAAKAALTMFEIGGYTTARKIYSLLITTYHPDKNPNLDAHTKAAAITKAWRELKAELGWS